MSIPVRCSVAAVVRRAGDASYLAVRRPLDDDRLPGLWGLPAVTLRPGELPESGIRRVGEEKLDARIEPVRFIGIRSAARGTYQLILMDIEADLVEREPDVRAATSDATRYIDQLWSSNLSLLSEAAVRGSLCCQILLESAGIELSSISDDCHPSD